ncbi:RHS repeat-associated core domain-containing protein [Pseudomonas nunensis]|uniref:RHS repeat-associated core domain-containing protein n=1 Tax=Pseudomonas nunensis TaxID=2961896 RepID=UPI0006B418EA|nr:RHS repeat-associated core domain-containing protein [Pseudomonas nunensis]KOY03544.1 toxin [Pseudomonas nunensis]
MNTVNWRTPSLVVNDSRGLPVRQVAYLRTVAGASAQTLITRQHHDVPGRPIEQWDPRLFETAPKPNLSTRLRLSGEVVRVDGVDGGWRLSLSGVGGEVLHRWDQRGSHWRMTYDEQLRVIAVEENAQPNIERFTYANASADTGHNLSGQMIEQVDPSGRLTLDSYGLLGQALRDTRTFTDGKAYLSSRTFSPLGALLDQTDAGGHRQQLRYDIAGQLTQVGLQIATATVVKDILTDVRYNADAQIIGQRAGNGVISTWTYDRADGRLFRLKAQKNTEQPLQDFEYFHDRVGNVTRIDDHVFTEVYFANQRVDGHRAFTYDSLYQLTSASGFEADVPHLRPGLPAMVTPVDTGRLYNYVQHYEYDTGSNLTLLRHVREGNNHTQLTRIAPGSNRGVRWKEGEPEPVFDELFDAHGNLRSLQQGQPLTWNSRDQLTVARLVERDGGGHDEETYVYSQGVRVSKRLVTQAQSASHVRQVRYLPRLEIRTVDDAEELHIITLGNVRCLHWVKGKPAAIEQDQLRYSLDDLLGSSTVELDRNGEKISHEIYYPFGGTAWWAATSQVQADYKTIRYSGKEMDVSGLYYYGAQYYAPWLQRWVSADPGGAVDGLNLYGFVGNNPLRYVDPEGGAKAESVITLYAGFLSILGDVTARTRGQLHDVYRQKNIKRNLLMNAVNVVAFGTLGYEAGNIGGTQVGHLIPDASHATRVGRMSRLPYIEAATGGNFGGDIAGSMTDAVSGLGGALADNAQLFGGRAANFSENMGRVGPLIPQTSAMSVAAIDSALGIPDAANEIQPNWNSIKDELIDPALNSILNPDFAVGRALGAWISILPGALNLFQRAVEAEDIKNRLDPVKIAKIEGMFADWESTTLQRSAWMEAAFDSLGTNVVHLDPGPNGARAPITRAGLQQATTETLHSIRHLKGGLAAYKEAGSTDNQFLAKQRTAAAKASRR